MSARRNMIKHWGISARVRSCKWSWSRYLLLFQLQLWRLFCASVCMKNCHTKVSKLSPGVYLLLWRRLFYSTLRSNDIHILLKSMVQLYCLHATRRWRYYSSSIPRVLFVCLAWPTSHNYFLFSSCYLNIFLTLSSKAHVRIARKTEPKQANALAKSKGNK